MRLIDQVSNCVVCGLALAPNVPPTYRFVSVRWNWNHHQVSLQPKTQAEAKLALKELKLAKRGIANVKRQIMEAKRIIRAKYTNKIRTRDSFTDWLFYKPSPAARRKIMADDLEPLEAEQRILENLRIQVEQWIVQIESWLIA